MDIINNHFSNSFSLPEEFSTSIHRLADLIRFEHIPDAKSLVKEICEHIDLFEESEKIWIGRIINILSYVSEQNDISTLRESDLKFRDYVNDFLISNDKSSSSFINLCESLIILNNKNYSEFQKFLDYLLRIFNIYALPILNNYLKQVGLEPMVEITKDDIVWALRDRDHSFQGAFVIPFPLKNLNRLLLALNLDYIHKYFELDSNGNLILNKEIDSFFAALVHEAVHAQRLINIGTDYVDEDAILMGRLEELTEYLAISIIKEVNKIASHVFFNSDRILPGRNSLVVFHDLLEANLFGEDEKINTVKYAIEQNPIGYLKMVDEKFKNISEEKYNNLIDVFFNYFRIGISQRDLLKRKRAGSIIDLIDIINKWENLGLGILANYGKSGFPYFKKMY
jgi:hypothetical protein